MDTDNDSPIASEREDEDELARGSRSVSTTAPRNALDALADGEKNFVQTKLVVGYSKPPSPTLQHQPSTEEDEDELYDEVVDHIPRVHLEIHVPPPERPLDFPKYVYDSAVEEVMEEFKEHGVLKYVVLKGDGSEEELTLDELVNLPGGLDSLNQFHEESPRETNGEDSGDSDAIMATMRPHRKATKRPGFVALSSVVLSDDEDEIARPIRKTQSRGNSRAGAGFLPQFDSSNDPSEASESGSGRGTRLKRNIANRQGSKRSLRSTKNPQLSYTDSLPASDDELPKRRGRPRLTATEPPRRSGRERKAGNMREITEDDIPLATQTDKPAAPKAAGAKEAFKKLPASDDFRNRHLQICDTCNAASGTEGKGFLIYCQGCSLAYHAPCLGSRSSREHAVTKIGDGDFVLQCRRCIGVARDKDPIAPDHGKCAACGVTGASCKPFRARKQARQEQKERDQNHGVDPVTSVSLDLIYKASNVLFRCVGCYQGFHLHHLPPKVDEASMIEKQDDAAKAEKRFAEYCETWLCYDCETAPGEIGALVAWRPKNVNAYEAGTTVEEVLEDEKEYLIKWAKKSYYRSTWKNGSWVWGKTSVSTRKAFARRDEHGSLPKMRTEDAIPEDYLRVDIVFDVRYNNKVSVEIEEVDRARIREVKVALVKYKGLAYEDAVWEEPPPVEDKERYADFKIAYEDWVRGKYMHVPAPTTLLTNIRKTRALNFEEKILQKEQPKSLKGGVLMQHQQDGLNWLLYKWYSGQNGILADEMGLGKTIQIIAFMATLQEKFNLAPFLIVVPNATCANWRREIKQWAPALRVATFFGSSAARDLAQKYELFPKHDKVLRCHVVVTSYDAAQDENCQRVFSRINWTALVVDEGQRLKNDKNLLYHALGNLKLSFTVLLTGTPIQNNPRELFNLLAFLDKSLSAQKLEEENQELTQEKVEKVHEMLKTFILRRTKRQTLKDLPAMAQIIVPLTMSPLQKKLYKSILGKNADLLKSIFGGGQHGSIKGLRNILSQLRQCLCHPYVYNQDIEGRTEEASSHRRLVEASAKLQILDIMLPKLKERGHRVLIFSQFLHMLTIVEDFLSGLALEHLRLDGTMGSMEKQKVIDAFNAPDSSIFALLLSTRAGGVGINLATADTVIIMDPDFNPHQDIQAVSRAHRLGQQKKVLVFQLMTRMSAEEKILQIGKKKMALDHVLIEQMDKDEEDGQDLESVLRYGAEALFKDDATHDIRYDAASVDKLLDRSQVEDTDKGTDSSAESSFSFARIWQNDSLAMADGANLAEEVSANNDDVWQKIMEERERQADEARAKVEQLGRGKRNRKTVDYGSQAIPGAEPEVDRTEQTEFDADFQARISSEEEEEEEEDDLAGEEVNGNQELLVPKKPRSISKAALSHPQLLQGPVFKRARVRQPPTPSQPHAPHRPCPACNDRYGRHDVGHCPVKLAGPEICNLCGTAHFGTPGSCPTMRSEEKIRRLIQQLKNSPEDANLVYLAQRNMRNELGHVVQEKKRKQDASAAARLHDGSRWDINGSQPTKRHAAIPAHTNGGNVPVPMRNLTPSGVPNTTYLPASALQPYPPPDFDPGTYSMAPQPNHGSLPNAAYLAQTISGRIYQQQGMQNLPYSQVNPHPPNPQMTYKEALASVNRSRY